MSRTSPVPVATYRLQFVPAFTLADGAAIVDYLSELGVSDVYASPIFTARAGSTHGYDVVDPRTVQAELGGETALDTFLARLQAHEMGLMLDVVPNHMGIDDPRNLWWQDVLEHGPGSAYAGHFDIDWDPPKAGLKQKVLLPFLGEQYGKVLESREIQLCCEDQRLVIAYHDRRFPLAPRTWTVVLRGALDWLDPPLPADDPNRMELESIVSALEHLPPPDASEPSAIQERNREAEVARRRLAALVETSAPVRAGLEAAIAAFNGTAGVPHSFDALEGLLAAQSYRLCYWRVATDEINYRRFFDINELAAIRVEVPEVFAAVHELVLRLVHDGRVNKLRIDHPDGLLDPQQYFTDLQQRARQSQPGAGRPTGDPLYVVAEKILAHDEALHAKWPVAGTTGYDFLNLVGGLFVERLGAYTLRSVYSRFVEQQSNFPDVLYDSKRTILTVAMSSELEVLAGRLDRISEQHRWSRDFTRNSLRRALREVIACFPVYRTYVRPQSETVGAEDRRRIQQALHLAKRRNPAMSPSFFDFIGSVLLLEHPEGLSEEDVRQRCEFVLKFQQFTPPVMAKGLEDTAFYRFYPLASLNEVGGDPSSLGTPLELFHRRNAERRANWPDSLLATATHDMKRGEDVRVRLSVLSEIPQRWETEIRRWQGYNARWKTELDGAPAPDANEEYLIYQTLVGTWLPGESSGAAREAYTARMRRYLEKALKEAKLHTSWLNPYEEYDRAVAAFVEGILSGGADDPFLGELDSLVRAIAGAGYVNSLSQTLLKICSPGAADFYQGTEFWDFSLVDPDNRRPVDFAVRQAALDEFCARAGQDLPALAAELVAAWPDERIKLFVIWRALKIRRKLRDVFRRGDYLPLEIAGPEANHFVAFARTDRKSWAVALVPRFLLATAEPSEGAAGEPSPPAHRPQPPAATPPAHCAAALWYPPSWSADNQLLLPIEAPREWRHAFTGEPLCSRTTEPASLGISSLLASFPVALLEGFSGSSQ